MLQEIKSKIFNIYNSEVLLEKSYYKNLLNKVMDVLLKENDLIRPYDKSGNPGGIIYLKTDIPTIIIPDLHARLDLMLSVLSYKKDLKKTVFEMLDEGEIQIVCVGDGFHSEARAFKRWKLAYDEYSDNYIEHHNIDMEMRESLGIMSMVMELKSAYPDNFHFLKGNHENILNESKNGNYGFRKFAYEGIMVKIYVEKFFGKSFLLKYSKFEKQLPLLAVGKNFLISHAEPLRFYKKEDIIEYKNKDDVIIGLTWTSNDESESGSVVRMLEEYIKKEELDNAYYFGGHRPIDGLYNCRSDNKYVQIHNPEKFIIAYIDSDKYIDLENDIVEIKKAADNSI